ncbi:Kelch repeat-containing protein [Isoptericola hypogeus]
MGSVSTRTVATPDDAGLDDGFFWMFTTTPGPQAVTATGARGYAPSTRQLDVDAVTQAEFALRAGQLSVSPGGVESSLELGDRTATQTVSVTNTGTAPARVRLGEASGDFVMQTPDGQTQSLQQIETSDGAPLQTSDVPVTLAAFADPSEDQASAEPTAAPWTGIANYPQAIMDNRVVTLDGTVYSLGGSSGGRPTASVWMYDPATLAWEQAAPLPAARSAMTVGVVGGSIVASSGWAAGSLSGATWRYDPLTAEWTGGAANPAPRAAAGQAVLDGRLFAVGGCTTAGCTPTSDDVVAYDPAADRWETLADYPLPVAYASCGAVEGRVVCTGGNDGSGATPATYAYDPQDDDWSRVADAPAASWGAAYAVANGDLTVVGGIQSDQITNAAFAYDGVADAWHPLPHANSMRYRGGAACGFYKIGGAWSSTNADRVNEVLPGFDGCAVGEADVPWLTIDGTTADLEPGESLTLEVTTRAAVDQPGTYSSSVRVREDTPYIAPSVPVTMTVTPPRSWGALTGVVRGVACDGTAAPLAGATVTVDARSTGWTFATDENGSYAYWMDRRHSPLEVYGSKDGYRPEWTTAAIKGGQTTTVGFDLDEVGC